MFAIIPECIKYDKRLNNVGKEILSAINNAKDTDGYVGFDFLRYISVKTGYSKNLIDQYLIKFNELGYIELVKKDYGKSKNRPVKVLL